MKYIVANWKANKTISEAQEWVQSFLHSYKIKSDRSIVICPPYPLLVPIEQKVNHIPTIRMGAQDISMFQEGPYTGETTAYTLSSLAKFALIGHSERRNHFNETESTIGEKIANAKKYAIEPILCVRNENDRVYDGVRFVTYEPESAISTGPIGMHESVDAVVKMKAALQIKKNMMYIYGGNVNENNCINYLSNEHIDGVMVGAASLNPHTFSFIVNSI